MTREVSGVKLEDPEFKVPQFASDVLCPRALGGV